MEKNIKDYLHLYLGCEVDTSKATTFYHNNRTTLTPELLTEFQWEYLTPILRPLSDMTDDERKDNAKLISSQVSKSEGFCRLTEVRADSTRYLLSKHFDLFGLIESGLAIDKTQNHDK